MLTKKEVAFSTNQVFPLDTLGPKAALLVQHSNKRIFKQPRFHFYYITAWVGQLPNEATIGEAKIVNTMVVKKPTSPEPLYSGEDYLPSLFQRTGTPIGCDCSWVVDSSWDEGNAIKGTAAVNAAAA